MSIRPPSTVAELRVPQLAPARALPRTVAVALLAAAALGLLPAWIASPGPVPGLPPADALVNLGVPLLRFGVDALGMVVVGLLLVPLLIPLTTPVARSLLATRPAVLVTATAWVVVALLSLYFQTAAVLGRGLLDVRVADLADYMTGFGAGRGLLLTAACGALLAAAAAMRRHPLPRLPELWLGIALFGLLPGPLAGHASDHAAHEPALILIALHVIAAAGWLGGLAAFVLIGVRDRHLVDAALPRYSALAGGAIALVAVTGVLNAVVRLPDAGALVGTAYGLVVIGKSVGVLGLGAFGWHVRRRLLAPSRRTRLAPWLAAELTLMAFTLGLAAALPSLAAG